MVYEFLAYVQRLLDKRANAKWHDYPLGKQVKASREEYLEIARVAQSKNYAEVEAFEKQLGFAVEADWLHELALHTQVVVKKSAINYQHGRLLYASMRDYIERSKVKQVVVLETGTARGFSSMCMSRAMADADIEGKILTFDVLPHTTKMFWNCIDDVDGPQTRAELLRNYTNLMERYVLFVQGDTKISLPKVQFTRVNFAFLDGAHTYVDVMKEYEAIRGKQLLGDVVFFDDYTPSLFPGVVQAVDEICVRYKYNKQVIKTDDNRAYVWAVKE